MSRPALRAGLCAALCAAMSAAPPVPLAAQAAPNVSVPSVRPLVDRAILRADSLYFRAGDAAGALRLLERELRSRPGDFEARWRAVRAGLSLAMMEVDRAARERRLRAVLPHAEALLQQRPDDSVALTWVAATKGRLAIDTRDNREKARLGDEVWALTARVLEMDSAHAMANDIRGKLHQEVSRLNGVERLLARVFVGGTAVGRASWEASERHLRRAVSADPDMVLFRLDLGETYFHQGKFDEAERVFLEGLTLPDRYPPDPVFKDRMRWRLDDIRRRRGDRSGAQREGSASGASSPEGAASADASSPLPTDAARSASALESTSARE